jgi:hypothetical protein
MTDTEGTTPMPTPPRKTRKRTSTATQRSTAAATPDSLFARLRAEATAGLP